MKKNPDSLRIKANAGFSLVEVMVGMVIALLGIIIVFQVFSISEGIKRTTTSGGDALQNGASALFTLERALKEAGYGLFSSTNLAPLPADPAGTAPVSVTPGAAASQSDSLTISYRQNWDFGSFPPDPVVFPSAVPPALTVETFSVNNQAQLVSSVNGVIADGIVLLKTEYGDDTDGDGGINNNEWSQDPPANVMAVYAVRVAVVARSAQPEKPPAACVPAVVPCPCNTTTVFPTWIASATFPLDLSANTGLAVGDDWKCYRYKAFETTVPLRNVIWRP